MADKEVKGSTGLDVVFKKLKVDKSWDGIARPSDILPESSLGVFKGKITKRSPVKDKEGENRNHHNKRTKPYERDDLPFGDEGLDRLSFQSEECKNAKCNCNRKHRTRTKSGDDLLNFAIACKSPQTSPERKIVKDSKFKLHHKEKDHKVVLRAARLKLHRLNWYNGPVLKRGTVSKPNTFGNDSVTPDFNSVAKSAPKWDLKTTSEQSTVFKSPAFNLQQSSKPIVKPKQTTTGNNIQTVGSQTLCTCRIQSRLSNQNIDGASIYYEPRSTVTCTACKRNSRGGSEVQEGATMSSSVADARNRVNPRKRRPSSPRTSVCPIHPAGQCVRPCSCAEQARMDSSTASCQDYSVDELASYLDEYVYIPKKMSEMAEMMYT